MTLFEIPEPAKCKTPYGALAKALLDQPVRYAIARIWRFSENEAFLRIALELENAAKTPRVGLVIVIESFLEILAEKGGK